MKVIAIASQKGGTGKTTLGVHLATAATIAGYDAVVIDLDPQGSAATWGDDRGESPPEVVSGQASRLSTLLESAAKEGFDIAVIDTGPAADAAVRRSAELSLARCRSRGRGFGNGGHREAGQGCGAEVSQAHHEEIWPTAERRH